jgi:hypothetical protein
MTVNLFSVNFTIRALSLGPVNQPSGGHRSLTLPQLAPTVVGSPALIQRLQRVNQERNLLALQSACSAHADQLCGACTVDAQDSVRNTPVRDRKHW